MVERAGRVKVGGAQTFLDLSAEVATDGSEQGLLSLAFSPDYATSGRFFVYLTVAGPATSRSASTGAATPTPPTRPAARVLLTIAHRDATNHNGGQLQFGPDGRLWLATGDGGAVAASAQDPALLLGKVIKLDVNSARRPVVASRAPQPVAVLVRSRERADRDRRRRQRPREEINVGLAGNYGWPCREGTSDTPRGRSALRQWPRRSRCSKDAQPATASARSPAATSSATRACRPCSGATCTAISARPRCARWIWRTRRRTRPLGLAVPQLELLR